MLRSHQLRLLAAQLRQLTAASSAPTPPPRWLHSAAAALSVAAPPVDALPEDRLLRDEREEVVRSEVDVDLPDDAALPPASARAAAAAAAPLPPPPGVVRSSFPLNGRQWTLETGRLARMADGACVLRCGGTTVLATASWDPTSFNNRRSASPNAAPLQVDYREKLYAVGRIPGSYNKREGMGKEHELLASRRLDRALRPLLPRGFVYNTDVDTAVLSADGGDDPEVLAINAASAALAVSDIPWGGPLGAVRVVLLGGEVHINPAPATVQGAELRLLVAATRERVVLVEGEGQQVGEAELLRALRAGVAAARELLPPQHDLAARGGRPKRPTDLAGADPAAARRMADLARAAAARVLADPELGSAARAAALAGAKEELTEAMRAAGCWRAEFSRVPGSGCVAGSDVDHAFAAAVGAELRSLVLEQGLRPDGRGLIDLRAVHAEPDHVPVVHGSALFEAGDTQALATVTVGSRSEQQRVESLLGGEASKRLFVHYSLPAFASPGGDRRGPPGGSMRHEMDASAFVENALAPSLPSQADFPFTLRLNAEALGVDGGAPGAAVCGASLALSHAGVPLKALVAAVSVGLVTEGGAWSGEAATAGASDTSDADESALWAPAIGRHELLTDPCESEASNGDMELRVAGTATGVTACLLDVRLPGGVPLAVVEEALGRAQVARLRVLAAMEKALPQERHPHMPVFGSLRISESAVPRVIGREGSSLRAVEAATGARVDVGDRGMLSVFAPSAAQMVAARAALMASSGDALRQGQVYRGKVMSVKDHGAYMQLPGSAVHALLHISEVAPHRIRAVEDVLSVGEEVEVVCMGRDNRGTVRVSRKAALARGGAPPQGPRVDEGSGSSAGEEAPAPMPAAADAP